LVGPNAVRTHRAQPLRILVRQLRSPVLILLAVTATISFFLGQRTDTVVIGVILVASIGLGFVNEYRAERATDALHSQVTHRTVVMRAGRPVEVDLTTLVPGDVVRLGLGEVVPADLRLLSTVGLECDESVLTGESLPADKAVAAVAPGSGLGDLTSCAFMGTIVQAGSGTGVVAATGADAEFGRIAVGLGERQPETEFQAGLRRFSVLLLQVAVALTSLILVANLVLNRPLIESLLFSLAIAVGITPQLLPAVVSTGLAAGSRQLAKRKVLVKRLVCIEDLGDMDVLVTDKTGTLTEGRITFTAALDPTGAQSAQVLLLGLLSTETDPASADAGGATAVVLSPDGDGSRPVRRRPARRRGHPGGAVRRRQPRGRRRHPGRPRPHRPDGRRRAQPDPGGVPRLPGPAQGCCVRVAATPRRARHHREDLHR
jgi:Mg2+-importing ATPase